VVIAIITILIALLLPLVKRAHQSAQNQVCKSNLRQISFAIRMYTDDNRNRFPDPYTLGGAYFRRLVGERDPDDPASLPETYGWSALLQPYLKVRRENSVWLCPATREDFLQYKNSYAGYTWPGGPSAKSALTWPNQSIIFENWRYAAYKPGVPAQLSQWYPPGYEYSAKWPNFPLVPFERPWTRWQGGPHYYNLHKNSSEATINADGYSHHLGLDLSIHIRRHYKLVINPNGYTLYFPEQVD
jgi:type II secretory pathway pseudopilin PulG